MKGDFSRNTFDPDKHFSRVLMQQGRVQLDADWNEQTDVLLHYLRALATDLIGSHGGPPLDKGGGFNITRSGDEFEIGKGRYYVRGLLCENMGNIRYSEQPGYPFPDSGNAEEFKELSSGQYCLAYLDVWERHITHVQDRSEDAVSIREVALDGPDTASRAQVVWQVKTVEAIPVTAPSDCDDFKLTWDAPVTDWHPDERGQLMARARTDPAQDIDPCTRSPSARYRGVENQLYRVEIHVGGTTGSGAPTFKWSRENGSVVFPVVDVDGSKDYQIKGDKDYTVTLEHLGRDGRLDLHEGDWMELIDDEIELGGLPGPLLQVQKIDPVERIVSLKASGDATSVYSEGVTNSVGAKHTLLHRWDQRKSGLKDGEEDPPLIGGAIKIEEATGDDNWFTLEDGVQIQFPIKEATEGETETPPAPTYRSGDYWLIPARTVTGDVDWPGPVGEPITSPPHGVDHYYAPLAIFSFNQTENEVEIKHVCRRVLKELTSRDVWPST